MPKPTKRTVSRAPAAKRARAPRVRDQARGQARDVFRVAILEAAERVFARRGFVETKVAEIAREAGMAAGTLYNYFESKDAIYQSICELRGQETLAQANAIADSDAPALERLRRIIEWILGHLESNAEQFQVHLAVRALAEWEMKDVHGEAALANYLEHLGILQRLCADGQKEGALRKDVTAADLATALAGITNGFIHAWLLAKPRPRLAASASIVFDLFCKGAAR
jgi:TetR/AcrR family fatty acid metabolism transcriptional regulator